MKAKTDNIVIKYKADVSELRRAINLAKKLEASLKRLAKLKLSVKNA